MKSRFKKSRIDKMIAGVCGGIADYFGWDPTIVRILFIVGAFIFFGSTILLYIILAVVMPD